MFVELSDSNATNTRLKSNPNLKVAKILSSFFASPVQFQTVYARWQVLDLTGPVNETQVTNYFEIENKKK